MYRVTVNAQKRFIHVAIVGFVDNAESDQLHSELRAAALKLRGSGPQFDMLADLREAAVLPSARIDDTEQRIRWLLENGLRKSATLVSSMLLKMQFDRMTPMPNFAHFASEEEALEWLSS